LLLKLQPNLACQRTVPSLGRNLPESTGIDIQVRICRRMELPALSRISMTPNCGLAVMKFSGNNPLDRSVAPAGDRPRINLVLHISLFPEVSVLKRHSTGGWL
jgi:hypothetical protein